jgi:hypothetical protein
VRHAVRHGSAAEEVEMRNTLAFIIAASVVLVGCGSTPQNPPPPPPNPPASQVSVSITASTTAVEAGQTATLTATVANSTNQNVTWHVNGKPGGDSSTGTIVNGVYTAPATLSAPLTVTVMAVAHADTSKSASVTLNIAPEVKLSITPTVTTIPAGGKQKFVAKLSDGTTPEVTWSVYTATLGGYECSITADGELTAPNVLGTVTVQATTKSGATKSVALTITVVHSNVVLNGRYVFVYDGVKDGQHVTLAGVLTADGAGNVTEGIFDAVTPSAVEHDVTFTGTYAVGADARGTMTLVLAGGAERTWEFAMSSGSRISFGEFSGTSYGTGVMESQSTGAALAGDGLYLLSSSPSPRGPAISGYIDLSSTVNKAEYDVQVAGQAAIHESLTVSYMSENPRRMTVTLKDSNGGSHGYRAYMVSSEVFYAVSLDSTIDAALRGVHQIQETFPSAAGLANYLVAGAGTTKASVALAGGDIVLAEGKIQSGTLDLNAGGSVTSWSATAGSYTSGPGRGEMHIGIPTGSLDLVTYQASNLAAFISTIAGTPVAGWIEQQPYGLFGTTPDLPCYTSAALYAANTGNNPTVLVGHLAPGDSLEGGNTVDVLQNGSSMLRVAVSSTLEAPSSGTRYVLKLSGPVARTYAVYSCKTVNLEGTLPESGEMVADPYTIDWPIYW